MNNIDVACFTETWLTENTKDQIVMDKYVPFHKVRRNALRASGGVSLFVNEDIPATKLDVNVPEDIESIWISMRPKWLPRSITNIIVAGVYYPGSGSPYAPSKEDIISHLTETVHHLYLKYKRPLFIILGDFNDLKVDEICDSCELEQRVKVPTRKEAILDLVLTNRNNTFYKDPSTLPSIGGSDHLSVLYEPSIKEKEKSTKKKISIRRFKKSSIIAFGAWLVNFNWNELLRINDVNQKAAYFVNIMWIMIDKFFPLIQVVVANDDKEWVTAEIKYLISKRQKAHHSKNFTARDHLARKIKQEIRKAKIKYNASKVETFSSSNVKEWYQHISKIINNGKKSNLLLNNVPELAQKPIEEIVNVVNNHFANICQTYPPLHENTVINEKQDELELKLISEAETLKLLRKFSKKSLGPNDFPKKLLAEFAEELALPYCDITNCALKSGIFPDAFKISEIVPIPKENPPRALKDLRPISKTPIGGKILEKWFIYQLNYDTKDTLHDPTQFGNSKGCSTTHYLIKLTDQAFKSTDKGHATTAITIDYSKAFDLVDHSTLIHKLIELKVRGKLIKLIVSFLSNRKHYTKINGIKSELVEITCGVPQGTISGPKLFTILINGEKTSKVSSYKFVDDKTLAHSYSGDPTSVLQDALDIEIAETDKDKMVINESKCNIITFNFSSKNIGPQNLVLNENRIYPVDKIKLLGVVITADLRWKENTAQLCKKVNKKLYILWKLKQFGVKQDKLVTAWKVLLRPIAEYAAPLWHPGLTASEIKKLESLQRKAVGLILGVSYIDNRRLYKVKGDNVSYEDALIYLGLTSMAERRETITCNFGLDTFNNERHKDFFEEKRNNRPNSRYKPRIQELTCNTDKYRYSSIPYMSRLLNTVEIGRTK